MYIYICIYMYNVYMRYRFMHICICLTSALATDQCGPRAELATRCLLLIGSYLCDISFLYARKQMYVCTYVPIYSLYMYVHMFRTESDRIGSELALVWSGLAWSGSFRYVHVCTLEMLMEMADAQRLSALF